MSPCIYLCHQQNGYCSIESGSYTVPTKGRKLIVTAQATFGGGEVVCPKPSPLGSQNPSCFVNLQKPFETKGCVGG